MKPNQKFTIEEIIQILDDVIVEFSRPYDENRREHYYFWTLLNFRGLTKQQMNHYRNVHPNQDVIDRFDTLREIQEIKLVEGMLYKDSNVNPSTAMKVLSCKYKWMEESTKRKLELEEMKIEQDSKVTDAIIDNININFVEDTDEC